MSRDGLERSTQRGAVTGNAVLGPGAPIQRIQVGPPKSHQLSHFSRSSVLPGSVGAVMASGSSATEVTVRPWGST